MQKQYLVTIKIKGTAQLEITASSKEEAVCNALQEVSLMDLEEFQIDTSKRVRVEEI